MVMPEIGSAWVTVAPSARGFGSKLNSAAQAEVKKSGIGNLLKTPLKGLGVAAGAALATAGVALANFTRQGLYTNKTMETFGAQWNVLTRDATGYSSAVALAAVETLKTQSTMSKFDLSQTMTTLLSANLAVDDAANSMNMLAKAAMDQPAAFSLMTKYYAMARQGIDLTAAQMNAMTSRGFNPAQVAADHMGKTLQELDAYMASTGKTNSDIFLKALRLSTAEGGQFADVFYHTGNTLAGAMLRAENASMLAGQAISRGLMPIATGAHQSLYRMWLRIYEALRQSEGLQRAWQAVGSVINPMIETITVRLADLAERAIGLLDRVPWEHLDGIKTGFAGVAPILAPLVILFAAKLAPALKLAAGALGPLAPLATPLITAFKGLTGPMGLVAAGLVLLGGHALSAGGDVSGLGTQVSTTVDNVVAKIGSLTTKIPAILNKIVTIVLDVVPTLATSLVGLIPTLFEAGFRLISTLVDAALAILPDLLGAALKLVTELVRFIPTLASQLSQAAVRLFTALVEALAVIVPQVIEAARGLVQQVVSLLPTFIPQLIGAAVSLFTAIVDAVSTIVPLLLSAVLDLVMQLVRFLPTLVLQLAGAAVELLSAIVDAVNVIVPQLLTAARELVGEVMALLPRLIPELLRAAIELFSAIVGAVTDIIPLLIAAAIDLVGHVVELLPTLIPQLLVAAVDLLMAIVEAIPVIIPKLIEAVVDLVVQVVTLIPTFLAELSAAADELFMGLVEAVPVIVPKLLDALVELLATGFQLIIDFVPQMLEAGKRIIMGLAEGIGNAVQIVVDSVSNVMRRVRDFLPFSPAKDGPFSGSGWSYYSGEAIIRALADGITAETPYAENSINAAMQHIRDYLPNSAARRGPFSGPGWTPYAGRALMVGLAEGIETGGAVTVASNQKILDKLNDGFREWEQYVGSIVSRAVEDFNQSTNLTGQAAERARDRVRDAAQAQADYLIASGTTMGRALDDLNLDFAAWQREVRDAEATVEQYARAMEAAAARAHAAWGTMPSVSQSLGGVTASYSVQSARADQAEADRDLRLARERLADLQAVDRELQDNDAIAAAREAVRQYERAVTDAGNAYRAAQNGQSGWLDGIRHSISASREARDAFEQLRDLGLRDSILREFSSAGPDGLPLMQEILAQADPAAVIRSMNYQVGLLNAESRHWRELTNGFYRRGKDAAVGLRDGLLSEGEAIVAAITELADRIVEAISSRLQIRSPSRVMYRVGERIGEGLVDGIESMETAVKNAVDKIVPDIEPINIEIDYNLNRAAWAAGSRLRNRPDGFGTAWNNVSNFATKADLIEAVREFAHYSELSAAGVLSAHARALATRGPALHHG